MSMVSPQLKIGLQFLGVWPGVPFALVNRVVYVSILLITQYFQYLYVIAYCKPGMWQNLVDNLPVTLDYSLTVTKLLTLWTNYRVVCKILAHMDSDWRECVNVEQNFHVMTTKANVSHFCTKIIIISYMFAAMTYLAVDYAIDIINATEGNNVSRHFPIKLLIPPVAEQSPIYELLFVIVFVSSILNTYTISVLNALIFTLVLHVSGQIEIICQVLKTSKKVTGYGSSDHTIGMLIQKHNKVITFSKNVDKLFSFMALMQVFWDTLVICGLGLFVMSSVHNDSTKLMKAAIAYSAVVLEIFIFCSAGEYLSFKSKSLAAAAYESLWYNMSIDENKNMLFIIMRSQKQLCITAGGMVNLSLELFTSVMKTSASYASVLHAMY